MQAGKIPWTGWRSAIRTIAWYAVLWAAGVQMLFWFGNLFRLRSFIDSLVYPAVVLAVLAIPAVKALWERTGWLARGAAAGLVLLMINAQLLRKAHVSYPLCAWTMYAAKKPVPLEFVELSGVREDGVRFTLESGELMSLSAPFMSRISLACEEAEKVRTTQPEKAERTLAELDGVLAELGRRHGRNAGAVPLKRVEFTRVYLGKSGERLREETLRSVETGLAAGGAR